MILFKSDLEKNHPFQKVVGNDTYDHPQSPCCLTDIRLEELLLLLTLLQPLLQLGELDADHVQVALVIRLQLVHDQGHVADLGMKSNRKYNILTRKKTTLFVR